MPGFLLTLAEITLTMSAVILLLLALGPVLARRYKIRWRYWAWLAVAVRLLIPINFSLPNAPVVLTPPDPGPVFSAPRVSSGIDATPVPSHPLPSPTLSIAPSSSQTTPAGSNTAAPSPQAGTDNTVPVSQAPAETDIPSISFSPYGGAAFLLPLAGGRGRPDPVASGRPLAVPAVSAPLGGAGGGYFGACAAGSSEIPAGPEGFRVPGGVRRGGQPHAGGSIPSGDSPSPRSRCRRPGGAVPSAAPRAVPPPAA